MESEDGARFIKELAAFVRANEKALANALQFQRKQKTSTATPGDSTRSPWTAVANASRVVAALPSLLSAGTKNPKLSLTPHHLYYLLTCFEELGINVGPLNVHLGAASGKDGAVDNLASTGSGPAASNVETQGEPTLWRSIIAATSAVKREQEKLAIIEDTKYLYSAFTKIPALRLSSDYNARLIRGFEDLPFDTRVPLHVFKNLQVLEIVDLDFRLFLGWDRMASQLRSLTLSNACVEDPFSILTNTVLNDMNRTRRRPPRPETAKSPNDTASAMPKYRNDVSSGDQQGGHPPSESSAQADARVRKTSHLRKGSYPLLDDFLRAHQDNAVLKAKIEVLPASTWRFLRHLSLSNNSLISVSPQCWEPLGLTLHSLDLSNNHFAAMPALAGLKALRALNLSNCMISSLESLQKSHLPVVTALNLRGNRLQFLVGIENVPSLERLDLRGNMLTDPRAISRVALNPVIREIFVLDNPFVKTHKYYRVPIFNLFRAAPGYSEDIFIDSTRPSYTEHGLLQNFAPATAASPAPELSQPGTTTKHGGNPISSFDRNQSAPQLNSLLLDDMDLRRRGRPGGFLNDTLAGKTAQLVQPSHHVLIEGRSAMAEEEAWTANQITEGTANIRQPSDSGYASRQYTNLVKAEEQDTFTLYSDVSTTSATTADGYKYQIVQNLINAMGLDSSAVFVLRSSPGNVLPIIQSFARQLNSEATSAIHRDASIFIHKHREDIVELLCHHLEEEDQVEQRATFPRGMPSEDVGKWIQEVPVGDFTQPLDGNEFFEDPMIDLYDEETENKQGKRSADFEQQWDFVSGTTAYGWLLSKLHQQAHFSCEEPNIMRQVGQWFSSEVLAQAPEHFRRMSRRNTSHQITMTFLLDWDPVAFLREQGFPDPLREDLWKEIICLTGSRSTTQATSCGHYMEQTWPLTHAPLMSLIDDLFSVPDGVHVSAQSSLPSAKLTASLLRGSFQLTVVGALEFLCEICEQLSWLSSALRSSHVADGVVVYTPKLEYVHLQRPTGLNVVGHCQFEYSSSFLEDMGQEDLGFCWSSLFQNPVLVPGYPVPRRKLPVPGLEMPINVMAALVRSSRVSSYGGKRVIKGFDRMLVPTATTSDIVVWHLFCNADGNRISYEDERVRYVEFESGKQVSIQDIENKRHILGWCPKVVDFTGHSKANFRILSSGLGTPPSSTTIEKAYIEAGDQVVGGVSVAIAKRDKPARLQARVDYIDMVDWVSSQAVVFFDVSDRRAWLVDGASATLHLVRASLEHDAKRPAFRASWLFDGAKLTEDDDSSLTDGRLRSVDALVDEDIRRLPVYLKSKSTGEHSLFQDRVEDILHYLQQMMDHQSEVETRDGLWLRNTFNVRKNLIGFDFFDISTRRREVWPRVQHLRETGYGWVDFVRKLKAITIFGAGFGSLLMPESALDLCSQWPTVLPGLDYLAAPVTLLKALHEERRATDYGRHEIVKDILWASSLGGLFRLCHCVHHQGSETQHHDPVQVLLPKGSKLFPRTPKYGIELESLVDSGAVVFGHNKYFKIRWPDSRSAAPVAGDPIGGMELNTLMAEGDKLEATASAVMQGSSDSSVLNDSLLTATTAAPLSSASSQPTELTGATTPGEADSPKPGRGQDGAKRSRWSRAFFFKDKK